MKSLLGKLGVVLVGLSFLMISGCANPLSDLVRSNKRERERV